MAFGCPDYFGNQPWKFDDGHMLAEAVIVNPVSAVMSELDNCIIFGSESLPGATEICSLRIKIEPIWASKQSTGRIRPSVSVISSLL